MSKEELTVNEFVFKCICGEENMLAYGFNPPIVYVGLSLLPVYSKDADNEVKIEYKCKKCKKISAFILRRILLDS